MISSSSATFGIEEFQDQALLDHGIFHQQHGAERAAADALDVLVAALDDVAGRERRDVELGALAAAGDLLHHLGDLAFRDQQRACRLGRPHAGARRARAGQLRLRGRRGRRPPRSAPPARSGRAPRRAPRWHRDCRLGLQLRADLVGLLLVGQTRERLDDLDAHVLLRACQQRRSSSTDFASPSLPMRAHHHRHGAGIGRAQHLVETRHGALAADFRQRIDRAFADPPVGILAWPRSDD